MLNRSVALVALLTVCAGPLLAARFEARVAMLDPAVGSSDGVVFLLKVLSPSGKTLATLLEKPVNEGGFWVIKRDLSAFGGQQVLLQLEVSPGPAASPGWDWAVWQRPVVRGADGKVLLDGLTALADAETGYALEGTYTVVGRGVQYNPNGGRDHGLCVWHGTSLPVAHRTVKEDAFTVEGLPVLTSVIFMHPVWENGIGNTFCRYAVTLPAGDSPMPDVDQRERLPLGFRGDLTDCEERPVASRPAPLADSPHAPDVDLVAMARRAMHYLVNNPSPERGYETRFRIMPLQCPPCPRPNEFDPVSLGDTENRMDWEFIFMREMTGGRQGLEVEAAIWKRILGYVREDGLSWLPAYCLCSDLATADKVSAMNWTTGATLVSLVERARRDHDPAQLALARKLFVGLRSMASWDTGRAYYEGGLDARLADGTWLGTGCKYHYPSILEPVVRYWETSHDPEALAFAQAFAEGQLANLQPGCGAYRIREDGSFGGYNTHLHMRPVLGVAHLGAVTGNVRYLEWSRRVYEFVRSIGTDWGWFPESPIPGHPYSETCNTADMVDVALWLARGGFPEYWDHVERYVRNYIVAAQWSVTPEYEALYRDLHRANPAGVEEGLKLMRRYEGGINACLSPNALAWSRDAGGMNMMGCCPPEGMRTLYTAWSNTVLETPRGVEVNLAFDRDHPAAKVVSFLPQAGRLTVLARKASDFYLRPPTWATRSQVAAFVNGQSVPVDWVGATVRFAAVKPGQELTLTYPLLDFRQTVHLAGRDFTYHWLGNTVVGVEPRSDILPIFAARP